MGFWSMIGNGLVSVAKSGMASLNEMNAEVQKYYNEYQFCSDEKLEKIVRNTSNSFAKRTAAFRILKERHGENGAKALIH